MTRDKVAGDALYVLKNLDANARAGRSNKLADVKSALENSVSLDFDSYFFFLRKFHYIAMDREAQLRLTEQGHAVLESDGSEKLNDEVGEFFADQISDTGETEAPSDELEAQSLETVIPPPPPPPTDLVLEAPSMPSSTRGGRRPSDESLTPPPEAPRAPSFPPPPPPPPAPLPLTAAVMAAPQVQPMMPLVPSAPTAPKGQDLDLRYAKFDQLGQGPLGTVFKGKHNALGLDVCIKELKDIFGYFSFLQRSEVIKRLKKELCAQAQVRHPGVLQVLDQNADVARPYYVLELCRGSLREKLDQGNGKGIPVGQAVRYFLQLSYALKAAHACGLTHHNIKPENVLFDAWGNAKLSDFGLSRVIEVDASKGMPQVFVGTGGMGYMSPELISRSKDAGPAADVYGLGILFYEMVTGQLPGRRSPLPSEVNAEVPAKLDPIFDKMTQDRKENRYTDFDQVFEAFYGAFGSKEYGSRGDLLLWSDAPAPA